MGRPLSPDDRYPSDAPAYAEEKAVRWELPVRINGTRGVLVIREFEDVVPLEDARRRKEGVSVRGVAVMRLDEDRRKP